MRPTIRSTVINAILALAVVLAVNSISCRVTEVKLPGCPEYIPSDSSLNALIGESGQQVTGVGLFHGALFVSTLTGIARFEGRELAGFYRCPTKSRDNFDGIIFDRANNQLWSYNLSSSASLFRFDGSTWSRMEPPSKPDGYTRGDVMRGFQGFSSGSTFWLQNGDHAWRWEQSTKSWTPESLPTTECEVDNSTNDETVGCFASIAPVNGRMLVVTHADLGGKGWGDGRYVHPSVAKPHPDRILERTNDQNWTEIVGSQMSGLYTKKVVVGNDVAFVQTHDDSLYRFSPAGTSKLDSLGKIDAITITSKGKLLVAFKNNGIYEYGNGWVKRFDCPYSQTSRTGWAELVEQDGEIAFATGWFDVPGNAEYHVYRTVDGKLTGLIF